MSGIFIGVFSALAGVGVVVMFIIAVIQEGKSERKAGFKQAFYTVLSLVMLSIVVGSGVALLTLGLKQSVFHNASKYEQRFNNPPPLFLGGRAGVPEAVKGQAAPVAVPDTTATYTCTDKCQFSDADKQTVDSWVTSYKQWQQENKTNLPLRRELASILAFLIVAFPLYIVFSRLMAKGAKQELADRQHPNSLRSFYFYFISFAGLIMAVIGLGGVINVGLKVGLKTQPEVSSFSINPAPNDQGVKSILACKSKCGFTAEQVSLAQQWLTDSKEVLARQQLNKGQYDSDLSAEIPAVVIGFPLFWYHFTRIRKESQDPEVPASTSTT